MYANAIKFLEAELGHKIKLTGRVAGLTKDTSLFDLINIAHDEGVIPEFIKDRLHDLRIMRNSHVHGGERQTFLTDGVKQDDGSFKRFIDMFQCCVRSFDPDAKFQQWTSPSVTKAVKRAHEKGRQAGLEEGRQAGLEEGRRELASVSAERAK